MLKIIAHAISDHMIYQEYLAVGYVIARDVHWLTEFLGVKAGWSDKPSYFFNSVDRII